jgi:hypothetical protein
MTKKEVIDSWRDLERFGFIGITGEACGIGIRYLVDLTEEAVEYLRRFFSTPIDIGSPVNRSDGQVSSAMLPWDMWRPLAIYLLLDEGHDYVIDVIWRSEYAHANYVRGITQDQFDDHMDDWRRLYDGHIRVWSAGGTAHGGLANRHVMSGMARG